MANDVPLRLYRSLLEFIYYGIVARGGENDTYQSQWGVKIITKTDVFIKIKYLSRLCNLVKFLFEACRVMDKEEQSRVRAE